MDRPASRPLPVTVPVFIRRKWDRVNPGALRGLPDRIGIHFFGSDTDF